MIEDSSKPVSRYDDSYANQVNNIIDTLDLDLKQIEVFLK